MKNLALLMVLALSACTSITTSPETTAQRFYGLVGDYNALQTVAVAYKNNCKVTALPAGCEAHVKQAQAIDRKAVSVIEDAVANKDNLDYALSHAALHLLFKEMQKELK